jgi:hypothetical protein
MRGFGLGVGLVFGTSAAAVGVVFVVAWLLGPAPERVPPAPREVV